MKYEIVIADGPVCVGLSVEKEVIDSIMRSIYNVWSYPQLRYNPSELIQCDIIEQIELVRS